MEKKDILSFSKNVITLFTGSFFAQVISFGTLIVLQRFFYSPEDYAPFRLFFEFTAVFSSISALRLESGLILERDDNNAIQLLRTCLKISIIISIVGGIIFLGYFLNELAIFENNLILIILMPIAIFSNGIIQIAQSFFTRNKKFKTISKTKIIHSFFGSTSQIATGYSGWSFIGLIIGRIIGLISANVNYVYAFFKHNKWNRNNRSLEKELLKKHRNFIWYTTPGIFLGNAINLLILMFFARYYGEEFTGLTAAAIQYLGLIIMLFTSSFAQVYYNEIAQIEEIKTIKSVHTFWLIRLLAVTTIGWIILIFIPNNWVTFILGEEWKQLMKIIKIISPWMAIMFIASSLSFIFIRLGKQKHIFFFDLFHIILIISSILAGHLIFQNNYTTLYIVTSSQVIFYIMAILLAYYFLNTSIKKQLQR